MGYLEIISIAFLRTIAFLLDFVYLHQSPFILIIKQPFLLISPSFSSSSVFLNKLMEILQTKVQKYRYSSQPIKLR
jgi:hypothetical protein